MANALGGLFSEIAGAIREKTGEVGTMKPAQFPDKILGISGSSADVRYVTFMNEDGTVEYGKKAVAVGDDCADPIARGVFGTPTKESTAQYSFTFGGWATTPGGGIDANALKAVNADKTVYAGFISAVRYYTITYYDSDGVTVLKTESLAYGSTPSYVPVKDGYTFDRWIPDVTSVTGISSYTAQWTEKVSFANSSWADIASVAESGKASETFALGDSRNIPVTINGKTYQFVAKIVGFNHDTLADGSGNKAGVSVMFFTPTPTNYSYNSSSFSTGKGFGECSIYNTLTSLISMVPSDLQSVIKPVLKKYQKAGGTDIYEKEVSLWIPGAAEIGVVKILNSIGTTYPQFKEHAYGKAGTINEVKNTSGASNGGGWWVRDVDNGNSQQPVYYQYSISQTFASSPTIARPLAIGFCI